MKLTTKIFAIHIYKNPGQQNQTKCISSAKDLSHFGYFEQEAISEFLDKFSSKIAMAVDIGTFRSTEREEFGEDYVCHVHAINAVFCGTVIADNKYPYRIGLEICQMAAKNFADSYPDPSDDAAEMPYPPLAKLLERYKKPEQADTILKMRRDLAQTAQIMHANMDKTLERGDRVENLVRKSDILKNSGKVFRRVVKKHAPLPSRSISHKIKSSMVLSVVSVLLAASTFATNKMISTVINPTTTNTTLNVDSLTAEFGFTKTCYTLVFAEATMLPISTCVPSRALGGASSCPLNPTPGNAPSSLVLIMMGIYFAMVTAGVGFAICVSRKPDMRSAFALISMGVHLLGCICYGVSVYYWATTFSNAYFSTVGEWCIPETKMHGHWADLTYNCQQSGCSKSLAWGYSSFIFWIGLACHCGVVLTQILESAQVMCKPDPQLEIEKKLNQAQNDIYEDDEALLSPVDGVVSVINAVATTTGSIN
eukprot:m.194724 g.194724  ORF g.194724 m.194724 type:complete len:480 (-) comp32540_c0_seq1:49-1488(-)